MAHAITLAGLSSRVPERIVLRKRMKHSPCPRTVPRLRMTAAGTDTAQKTSTYEGFSTSDTTVAGFEWSLPLESALCSAKVMNSL